MAPITWRNVAAPQLSTSFVGDAANLFNKGLNQGQELIQGKIDEDQNTALQNLRQQAYQDPNLTQEGLNSLIGSAGLDAQRQEEALNFGSKLIRQNASDAREQVENEQADTLFGLKQTQAKQGIQAQENIFTDRAKKEAQQKVKNTLVNSLIDLQGSGMEQNDIFDALVSNINADKTLDADQKVAFINDIPNMLKARESLTPQQNRLTAAQLKVATQDKQGELQPIQSDIQTVKKSIDTTLSPLNYAETTASNQSLYGLVDQIADPQILSWAGKDNQEVKDIVKDYQGNTEVNKSMYAKVATQLEDRNSDARAQAELAIKDAEKKSGKKLSEADRQDVYNQYDVIPSALIAKYKGLAANPVAVDPNILKQVLYEAPKTTSFWGSDKQLKLNNFSESIVNKVIQVERFKHQNSLRKRQLARLEKQQREVEKKYAFLEDDIRNLPFNEQKLRNVRLPKE